MAALGTDSTLTATIEIDASPTQVWRVVSDVARTGEWSPECSKAVPIGEVGRGSWIVGLNHRKWVYWVTTARIVTLDAVREIGWRVPINSSVWTYHLEPSGTGTRLTETRETPNGVGGFARGFTRVLLGGQRVHDDELEAGMHQSLERIKAIVERE